MKDKILSHEESQIDVDMLANEDMKHIFTCVICINLVVSPMECTGCNKLFCMSCIEIYQKRWVNNPCPNCQ